MFGRSGNGYGMSSFSFPSYTVSQFLSLFLPFLTNSYRARLYDRVAYNRVAYTRRTGSRLQEWAK